MNARIQKWGNSLALRIPRSVAEDAGLVEGSEVDLRAGKGKLVVRPLKKKAYTLAFLLKGVRKANRHKEVDWGPPVGREVW